MSNTNPESYINKIMMSSFVAEDNKLGNEMRSTAALLKIELK
jgi:hypothetical protein